MRSLANAEHVLDDRDEARQRMSSAHGELIGKTLIEVARTEIGARRVDALLNKLFFRLPL